VNTENEKTQHTASRNYVEKSQRANDQSMSLSTNVAVQLLHLMKEVTKEEVTPQTVNAACNCATQLINLMKLNVRLMELKNE